MSTDTKPQVDVDAMVGNLKPCDCRPFMVQCVNPAAWLYRHRCCGGTTFVCKQCRRLHREKPRMTWACRWCAKLGTVAELVSTVVGPI